MINPVSGARDVRSFLVWAICALCLGLSPGCSRERGQDTASATTKVARGHLLIIGGGLENSNRAVYGRFVELARKNAAALAAGAEGPVKATGGGAPAVSSPVVPRIVIATAATLDEAAAVKGKTEAIRGYCPECVIEAIARDTPEPESVALVTKAHGLFFTGGDQKRITTRYLREVPAGAGAGRPSDTAEAAAMRALLDRGGVIAGTSAGAAMMSDPMFLTGGSTEALGIAVPTSGRERGEAGEAEGSSPQAAATPQTARRLGPQIGKGMGFTRRLITDSHFLERHRFGRLVAALEESKMRLGVGVAEDACVELDLRAQTLRGISEAPSLAVDIGGMSREELVRRGVRAMVIARGTTISIDEVLRSKPTAGAAALPSSGQAMVPVPATSRDERRTAARRFFELAATDERVHVLELDGYRQIGTRARTGPAGWAEVWIEPVTTTK